MVSESLLYMYLLIDTLRLEAFCIYNALYTMKKEQSFMQELCRKQLLISALAGHSLECCILGCFRGSHERHGLKRTHYHHNVGALFSVLNCMTTICLHTSYADVSRIVVASMRGIWIS